METNENRPLNINYGWKCPVCGRILAPWVPECPCNGFSNPRDITLSSKKFKSLRIDSRRPNESHSAI